MTDVFDRASDLEQAQRDAAIAAVRECTHSDGESAEYCNDCGDVIPMKRRLAAPGCQRCVHCQSLWERRRHG
ncbi:TraR/DksA family transcriptional regulator [Leeia sp. TBRC 13508]|uniref:TraR/DksA family transcriptional regulator n=1 Tax=Leeia speluncae TaxID=2884804 RepID=A0ABS8D2D5_9NEIS|nr:TraR/DksA family transcriptional regulator [Leeia speluncae]MCB6182329.1 TraR/DksA family transcriptional regulator [Leeia speluncae]